MLAQVMQTVLHGLYPPRCLSCGCSVESDFGLCGACWRDTPFITGLCCDHCGTPLPGESDQVEYCDACLETPRPWDQGRSALVYKETARRLVLALKHGDRQDIARPAGQWMARATDPIYREDSLVLPVPLHFSRLLKRRYNQASLLAQVVAAELGGEWIPDALVRPRRTPPLENKGYDQRFETLAGKIGVAWRYVPKIEGRPVLIVDDVFTSGATLAACTNACLAAGASEVCISVLARADRNA